MERCAKITATFLGAGGFFANPGSVHVEGSRATGRCHHLELFFFPDGLKWFLTYYDDVDTKLGGRWYFQKRTLTVVKNGAFGAAEMPK